MGTARGRENLLVPEFLFGNALVREALLHACPVRLRPILMTTFAMVAGAIPGAVATGPGSELRAPMFLCIIGGLLVSTVLTLVVVPCFYSVIDQLIQITRRAFGGGVKKVVPEAPPGEAMGK